MSFSVRVGFGHELGSDVKERASGYADAVGTIVADLGDLKCVVRNLGWGVAVEVLSMSIFLGATMAWVSLFVGFWTSLSSASVSSLLMSSPPKAKEKDMFRMFESSDMHRPIKPQSLFRRGLWGRQPGKDFRRWEVRAPFPMGRGGS